jgi:X-X-X-Leu-X-X-Gly heptad repeat protein
MRRTLPVAGVVAALSLVLAGGWALLAPQAPPPVAAEGPALENTELVLADLDPSGLPEDAVLVSTVVARGGEQRAVEDPASTLNVGYLDRRGTPETGDGVVLVEVGGPGTTSAVTEATFDRPLPVALHAEYSLDGSVVSPDEVPGASGLIAVRYTVTNTTAQTTTLRYTDAAGEPGSREVPVFVPFTGSLTVLVPRTLQVVDAGPAVASTDASGHTVLTYALLLAPPLGTYQQEATFTARTRDGATPEVLLEVAPSTRDTDPATGFSASALDGSVEGNSELASGLGELSAQTALLEQGAGALAAGSDALASGAVVLADGISGPLLSGSRELSAGADRLATGVDALAGGLAAAEPGARELATGASALAAGLTDLASGIDALAVGLTDAAGGAGDLGAGAELVADAVGSAADGPWPPPGTLPWTPEDLQDLQNLTPDELADLLAQVVAGLEDLPDGLPDDVPPPTLVQSLRLLQQLSGLLTRGALALLDSVAAQTTTLAGVEVSAAAAAAGAAGLEAELLGGVTADATDAATGAATAKLTEAKQGVLALALAGGLTGMDAALGYLEDAVGELSLALRSGDLTKPGLVEGLVLLEQGLDESVAGAALLRDGAADAATGAGALATGGQALVSGIGEATAGADALSQGADALASGTAAQASGVAELSVGAGELAGGARQGAVGAAEVAGGVTALREEGIDEIETAIVEASTEPALASAWLAATDARASDALPYGPPDGAVGHAAYRLTMASTTSAGTPAWQWWLLGAGVLAAFGWGAARRLREPS